jgi:hypothetical protein
MVESDLDFPAARTPAQERTLARRLDFADHAQVSVFGFRWDL